MNLPEKTALAGFGMGVLMCLLVWQPWKPGPVPTKPVDLTPLTARVEALEALAPVKCVSAGVLNITVYEVPNLGVHKVPPSQKPETKMAEVAP
jgi:hypothetical protein